jgi:hypothetical protein
MILGFSLDMGALSFLMNLKLRTISLWQFPLACRLQLAYAFALSSQFNLMDKKIDKCLPNVT